MKFIKNKKYIIGVGILLVVIILFFSLNNSEKIEYVTAEIEQGQIVQTVSETGMVKAANEIDLSFLNGGKLANILFHIGDVVKKDDIVALLDDSGLLIRKSESEANLVVAQSNLSKLLNGPTSHERAVSRASVDQSKSAYDSAKNEYSNIEKSTAEAIAQAEKTLYDLESDGADTITSYEQAVTVANTNLTSTKNTYQRSIDNYESNAITTMDTKISIAKTALDNIYTILHDPDAGDNLGAKNQSVLEATKSSYSNAVNMIPEVDLKLEQAKTENDTALINLALSKTSDFVNASFSALNYCYSALENSVVSTAFTQTELDAYKATINTQQTYVSTAVASVQSAQQNLNDALLSYQTNVTSAEENLIQAQANLDDATLAARNALMTTQLSSNQQLTAGESRINTTYNAWQVTQAQYNNLVAPARSQDISLAQAQVRQAEASLNLVKNQIEDSVIKSPIDGTITKSNYEIGEQISLGMSAFSILGENDFEIEIDISEADISKIAINDPVEITLDAFGDEIKFTGYVYFIEPAETVIQDVIYYKVKINFEAGDHNVKSGMTANSVITTAQKDNVVIAPSRAIVEKNGDGKFIRVLKNNEVEERPVEVGLRGDGGMVEILSGVQVGESVVTFTKTPK